MKTRIPTCTGTNLWPVHTSLGFECPHCRQPFSVSRLEGRDQHCPSHEPRRESDHDAAETFYGVQ